MGFQEEKVLEKNIQVMAYDDKEVLFRRKAILDEYFKNGFHKRAAVNVIYKDSPKSPAAASIYWRNMMKNPDLLDYKKHLEQNIAVNNNIQINEVVTRLAKMFRVDLMDVFNKDGTVKELDKMSEAARMCIQSIEMERKKPKDGRRGDTIYCKVVLYSQLEVIEKLMKHLGGYGEHNSQTGSNTYINRPKILIASKQSKTAPARIIEVDSE